MLAYVANIAPNAFRVLRRMACAASIVRVELAYRRASTTTGYLDFLIDCAERRAALHQTKATNCVGLYAWRRAVLAHNPAAIVRAFRAAIVNVGAFKRRAAEFQLRSTAEAAIWLRDESTFRLARESLAHTVAYDDVAQKRWMRASTLAADLLRGEAAPDGDNVDLGCLEALQLPQLLHLCMAIHHEAASRPDEAAARVRQALLLVGTSDIRRTQLVNWARRYDEAGPH